MKKLVLTAATVLFLSGLSMAKVVTPAGDNDDKDNAQHSVTVNVPTVALVDVENAEGSEADITLSFNEDDLVTEAGSKLVFKDVTNNNLYLQYTSIIRKNKSQSITAELQNSNIPSGMNLQVSTAAAVKNTGTEKGTTGTGNTDYQTLETVSGNNGSAKTLVSGIGTCYTGTGGAYGHQLTYRLTIDDTDAAYNNLTADSYETTVVYTISAGTSEN